MVPSYFWAQLAEPASHRSFASCWTVFRCGKHANHNFNDNFINIIIIINRIDMRSTACISSTNRAELISVDPLRVLCQRLPEFSLLAGQNKSASHRLFAYVLIFHDQVHQKSFALIRSVFVWYFCFSNSTSTDTFCRTIVLRERA